MEEGSLEGGTTMGFQGGVSVASIPAGVVVYVDASLLFHIWYPAIGAGGSRSISWKMQLFVFFVEVLLG